MDHYRNHRLYKMTRSLSGRPLNWDDPDLVRLQQEMRLDFMEATPTINVISMTAGIEDAQALIQTLTEITTDPEGALERYTEEKDKAWDAALGEGRH